MQYCSQFLEPLEAEEVEALDAVDRANMSALKKLGLPATFTGKKAVQACGPYPLNHVSKAFAKKSITSQ